MPKKCSLAGRQNQHAQRNYRLACGKETRFKEVENLLATEQYALDEYQGLKNYRNLWLV